MNNEEFSEEEEDAVGDGDRCMRGELGGLS